MRLYRFLCRHDEAVAAIGGMLVFAAAALFYGWHS